MTRAGAVALPKTPLSELLTEERRLEIARILGVGAVVLLFRLGAVPLPVLLAGVAAGLYPLVKTGVLAGMLLHLFDHMPKEGDATEWAAWRFEVIDMDGPRIDKVLASRASHSSEVPDPRQPH